MHTMQLAVVETFDARTFVSKDGALAANNHARSCNVQEQGGAFSSVSSEKTLNSLKKSSNKKRLA